MLTKKKTLIFFFCILIIYIGCEKHIDLSEASGITLKNNKLLFVTDKDAGIYFEYNLSSNFKEIIKIDTTNTVKIELTDAKLALDLEAIDVLVDGRIVALSERLRSLVSIGGIIAEYPEPLSEIGNLGLEGLAIRHIEKDVSRIAILWEGGYPEYEDLPLQLRTTVGRKSVKPEIWIHDIKKGERNLRLKINSFSKTIKLNAPEPEGDEPQAQRFRAPDLVWHKINRNGDWGFIVLLNSGNSSESNRQFLYARLQKFNIEGDPVGTPLDLYSIIPGDLKKANWEGLGWYEEGKKVIIIHDKPPMGTPTAFIIDITKVW